ncbi:MAG: DNA polymerase III subunit delta [Flavobacteriaceae bacterium]
MQTYETIINQIQKGQFSPIYLLMGEEPYFIDQVEAALEAQLADEASKAFDYTLVYGKEAKIPELLEVAKRYPMLSEKQLLVVREAQYMDKNLEPLATYAQQPQPQTVLVICWKHKSLDKRSKLYKAIQKTGVVLEAKPIYDNQVPNWIQQAAKGLHLKLTPEAVQLLAASIGADLQAIENALKKIRLVMGAEATVDLSAVESHVGISKSYNNFELQKAIGERNIPQALKIAAHMGDHPKKHPLVLTLSTLHRYFLKIISYQALTNKQQAAQALGINPYFVREYQLAAQHYSMKQCAQALAEIYDYDLRSKGLGAVNKTPKAHLQELLMKIFVA